DALDAESLQAMSGSAISSARVLAGIDAAGEAGLTPVKVNMVVRRGYNEQCVTAMAEHFRHRPEILRFIEYMDVGSSNGWREHALAGVWTRRRDRYSAERAGPGAVEEDAAPKVEMSYIGG